MILTINDTYTLLTQHAPRFPYSIFTRVEIQSILELEI